MNKSYLIGDINFSFSFNLSYINEMEDGVRKKNVMEWERNCIYSAIIRDVDGEIFILLIDFNKEGNEDSISFINRQWNDYIPSFEFGKYLEIHEAYINKIPIRLDLSSTRLRGMVSANDCYCRFYIDKYQYSYAQVNERCSTLFYLSKNSKNLIGDIWGLGLFTGNVESKKLTFDEDISFAFIMNNKSELFPIIIEFDNTTLLQNRQEFRLLCDIISFYYAMPIECCISIEFDKDLVKVTREISHNNMCQKISKNCNLCYLNYGISHRFVDFLTVIYDNRNKWEDKLELLHTTMNDYVRSFGLDERARFLVLYSVIETYSKKIKQSVQIDKIELHNKMVHVFENLYPDFIKNMEVDDELYYRNLWADAKKNFYIKGNHSIVELFNQCKIDNDKVNEEIKKAPIKTDKHKINNISDLRNQLMHNRNIDYVYKLPMDIINIKLSFSVCIILLYNLGFSCIVFNKDWLLLSILKEDSNKVVDK